MISFCICCPLQDKGKGVQFTVMTDRAQGGASLNDGQLELMVKFLTLIHNILQ